MSERGDAMTAGAAAAPTHVAIIMDGNGRWARHRGLPRIAGHRRGVDAVREAIAGAHDSGVRFLTLFGFSSENWKRPVGEISDLMQLLRHYLRGEIAELHRHGIRLRVIGDRSRLQPDIVAMIDGAEDMTRRNESLNLTVALSYGGRGEIVAAARRVAAAVAKGEMSIEQIDEESFGGFLSTSGIPDPDLVIRTSGEQRLSNFLLWQSAYAELFFVDTLWPEFTRGDFQAAVREYQRRERRYGAATG
jgi:undecaprenyl diphosphate synthase